MLQKQALSLVFSNRKYIVLSALIFFGLLFALSTVSEFIFFSPKFIFYVPTYDVGNFILILLVASLSGLVSSLSVYRIRMMGTGIRKSGSGFLGSVIGASAGACSCGSFGFAAVSAFGTIGGTATAFLTNYELPLRLVSIAVLVYAYYVSVKGISNQCKIVK